MDSMLEGFPGLLFFMNQDGKIVYVNSAAENVTGIPGRIDAAPLKWLERVQADDRERVALAYQKALLTGEGHKVLAFKFNNKYGKECEFVALPCP